MRINTPRAAPGLAMEGRQKNAAPTFMASAASLKVQD